MHRGGGKARRRALVETISLKSKIFGCLEFVELDNFFDLI